MNRAEEGLQEQKRATEIDPFARPWALGLAYFLMRQYDAAIDELRMREEVQSPDAWVHYVLSDVYEFKGMEKESIHELEEATRIDSGEKAAEAVRRTFEHGGRKAVSESRLNNLKARARQGYVSPWDLAVAYAWLGDREGTLKQLETAYRERSARLVFLQSDPFFDFVHSDPRYQALVKQMGLPPAY
jgi:tetratricopeptide (TPR) repeat protein